MSKAKSSTTATSALADVNFGLEKALKWLPQGLSKAHIRNFADSLTKLGEEDVQRLYEASRDHFIGIVSEADLLSAYYDIAIQQKLKTYRRSDLS